MKLTPGDARFDLRLPVGTAAATTKQNADVTTNEIKNNLHIKTDAHNIGKINLKLEHDKTILGQA